MCVAKLLSTSECGIGSPILSLVGGNTERSPYRVLRVALSRGNPRSVDRECAGRNARSVKGSSPDSQCVPWWPSQYAEAKAASRRYRSKRRTPTATSGEPTCEPRRIDTTGVLDHGMYTRPATERKRSVMGRATEIRPRLRVSGQGVTSKSKTRSIAEVRCSHSSEEVE